MFTLRSRRTFLESSPVGQGAPPTALDRLLASHGRWVAVVVVALAVGTAPAFLRTFVNDDGAYALIAQKLNAGARLYRDAVDNKPPLIYATFAAVFRALGSGAPTGMKVLTLVAQLASALLLATLGHRLFGARAGALAGLLFSFAAVTGLAKDFAAPNTEIFANPFIVGALVLLARDLERPARGALLAAGALIGLASLYRLPSATALLGVLLFVWSADLPRWERVRMTFQIVAGFAAPLAIAAAYFCGRGTAGDLWLWAVRGNVSYVRVGEAHLASFARNALALVVASHFPLLFIATRVGVLWPRAREPHRTRLRFVLLQLLTALFAYRTGNRFYGHYFLQVVPFLALVGAWGFLHLPRSDQRWLRLVPAAMVSLLVVFTTINVVRAKSVRKVDGLDETIAIIDAETSASDEVLLWSAPPEIAFDSGRRFATRFVFNNYLTGRSFGTNYALPGVTRAATHPLENPDAWRLLRQDLAGAPPALIVDGDGADFSIDRYPSLAPFLQDHYDPPRHSGRFTLYRRRAERAVTSSIPTLGDR
jgi:hypothetical protein